MDTFSREKRSEIMRRVRSSDTGAERLVRKLLHRCGYRFRLHDKNLPGNPDIVLNKYGTVIFVHGCFWHRHKGCSGAAKPGSNVAYWESKFERNRMRDRRNVAKLRRLGWKVIIVWECQLRKPDRLLQRLQNALGGARPYAVSKADDVLQAAESHAKYKTKAKKGRAI